MELLIIKSNDRYIRCRPEGYELVGMDKASVFPLSRAQQVQEHLADLRQQGFSNPIIRKLVITETEYTP